MNTPPPHRRPARPTKPPLRVLPTTLWEYPSQHYETFFVGEQLKRSKVATQGSKDYAGATPSWVIWQLLMRYTRPNDTVVDPCCGSGTTLDVCADLDRRGVGFDLSPSRPDIRQADARHLPLEDSSVDFAFIDPPYSTHIEYSDKPQDIGRLSASGQDGGKSYYEAMHEVIMELHRVLRNRRYMALYVSDSWKKRKGGEPGSGAGTFMPIGFELFHIMVHFFRPVDIICVARRNQKLDRGNWRKAAEEGNFFLRGFNYLFIMKKEEDETGDDEPASEPRDRHRRHRR